MSAAEDFVVEMLVDVVDMDGVNVVDLDVVHVVDGKGA